MLVCPSRVANRKGDSVQVEVPLFVFVFFFFLDLFIYLFYAYEYIIAIFRYIRKEHQIPLQMVVSHHVVAGN